MKYIILLLLLLGCGKIEDDDFNMDCKQISYNTTRCENEQYICWQVARHPMECYEK